MNESCLPLNSLTTTPAAPAEPRSNDRSSYGQQPAQMNVLLTVLTRVGPCELSDR